MNSRAFALALVAALTVLFVGISGGVPNAQLTVAEVTVEPEEPTATEPVTITPTIESSVGSDEPVEIDRVTATVAGEEIGEQTNVGTLSPGDEVSVPFTTTFDEAGTYTVEFTFVGTDAEGEEVTLTREETVTVSPVPPVRLTVDNVDVEPETPTAGAPVTVPITVDSSGGSTQPLDIERVTLRDGTDELATATDVGSLAVGDSVTVPLTTIFDEMGTQSLEAELVGTNAANETVRVTQPVSIAVEQGAPVVEFGNVSGVEGTDSELTVDVSNPTEATLRNLVVTVDSDGATGVVDRRVVPSLAPGETTELSMTVRPESAGEALLQTNLSYTTAAGTSATTDAQTVMPVAPLEDAVSVRVQTVTGEPAESETDLGVDVEGVLDTGGDSEQVGDEGDIEVTVSNLGNAAVSDVVLDPRADNRSLGPRPVADTLAPGAEESVIVSLEGTPATEILFETTYDVGTESGTSQATFDPGNRGAVSVTGVDLSNDGNHVEITGDIGNPGGEAISGVVVAVNADEAVSPVYPNRDFFVGEIDSNGFAPFELTASVGENATHVPLEVTYLVDGDQRTEEIELPVEEPPDDSTGDGPSFVLVGGVVGILGLLLTVIVFFARRG